MHFTNPHCEPWYRDELAGMKAAVWTVQIWTGTHGNALPSFAQWPGGTLAQTIDRAIAAITAHGYLSIDVFPGKRADHLAVVVEANGAVDVHCDWLVDA